MKVVILAGGLGTRLSEYTKTIPKPMVPINGKPMIVHIMNHYYKYGFKDFYIALGYKSEVIKKYFKKTLQELECQFDIYRKNTMTGGRIKGLKNILETKHF